MSELLDVAELLSDSSSLECDSLNARAYEVRRDLERLHERHSARLADLEIDRDIGRILRAELATLLGEEPTEVQGEPWDFEMRCRS